MKKVKFFFDFYRQSILAILILLFLMTGSIFYFVDFMGVYNFNQYTLKTYQSMGIENSVYYMPHTLLDKLDEEQEYQELRQQNFSAIKNIITQVNVPFALYQNEDLNIIVCDQEFIDIFDFAEKGQWFTAHQPSDSEVYDIVASGYLFADKKVGDIIEIYNYGRDGNVGKTIKGRIIGIDKEPSYILSPGYSADIVTTGVIFGQTHNTVYMRNEDVKRFFEGYTEEQYQKRTPFPIIVFHDDATAESKQEVLEYLGERGSYVSYNEIIESSKRNNKIQMKRNLPLPLFMVFVSAFAMIAVSILLTNKKLTDYKIYYLCGCSRKRSFLYILLAIGLVGAIAGAINVGYVLLMPQIFMSLPNNEYTYKLMYFIVGSDTVVYIIAYTAITILISILIPFLLIKKNSAVEFYRRQS